MEQKQLEDDWYDEKWSIKDDAGAEWAMDTIRQEAAERDRLKMACDTRIDFYERRKTEADKQYENKTAFLMNQLSDYFDKVPHRKTKTQETYALPSGKLVLKQPNPHIVKDDTALLDWAKVSRPDSVVSKETVNWGELKKTLQQKDDHYIDPETGEVVGGVKLEAEPAMFKVDLEG